MQNSAKITRFIAQLLVVLRIEYRPWDATSEVPKYSAKELAEDQASKHHMTVFNVCFVGMGCM